MAAIEVLTFMPLVCHLLHKTDILEKKAEKKRENAEGVVLEVLMHGGVTDWFVVVHRS